MLHAEGPLCSIDLTERSSTTETIDDVTAELIGGRGVATKLPTDRLGPATQQVGVAGDDRLRLGAGGLHGPPHRLRRDALRGDGIPGDCVLQQTPLV